MIQLKAITKTYRTGNLVQVALNQIFLNFRDNEFVSILGASGSGKSTLLNIIGGLDRYDSGDLIINGISTNRYSDRDWDTYRNHSIGFVFQNYNLISHQSVLANVELSLTMAGVKGNEKRERALQLLRQVGLEDQKHKLPSQLSGGQMQRVAIARALVNNPDILLADEPTGALDTVTSHQIMELLKEVAKDRLVIMVTHNPELADQYSTRIVKLKDGQVVGDSNPYMLDENNNSPATGQRTETEKRVKTAGTAKTKKASMSFSTALSLSFKNLCTKKGRTLLTAFAGSIGIIGIALIIALSSGVNRYIEQMQKDTMSTYPIAIEAQTISFDDMSLGLEESETEKENDRGDKVYTDGDNFEMAKSTNDMVAKNDLRSFKKYLDDKNNEIWKYVGQNGIEYSYNTPFSVYAYDPKGTLVNTDGSNLSVNNNTKTSVSDDASDLSMSLDTETNFCENLFSEIEGENAKSNYDILYGQWPTDKNQLVLEINEDNEIPLEVFYQLGLLPADDYQGLMDSISEKKKFEIPEHESSYEKICDAKFYLLPACDFYQRQKDGSYELIEANDKDVKKLLGDALELKISAVVKLKEDIKTSSISTKIGYTKALTDYLISYANGSEVVKDQLNSKETSILDGAKISEESYYASLQRMGYVDEEEPEKINIYVDSFEDKEKITECIDQYNKSVDKSKKIVYTDMMQVVISSVTQIVDIISYILIAFVAISLIVSSLMIGIITYISVLERRKEIGILRAVGASRRNIKQVFNAETVLVGAMSGIIGVGISELFIAIINAIIHMVAEESGMSAYLPVSYMLILIGLSMLLTLIGGLIPSAKAAKEDPVKALRSE